MDKPEIHISVRNLVEFILRSGDLRLEAYMSADIMLEGTRIHRKLQKAAGEEYQAEVRLIYKREYETYALVVDGIIRTEAGVMVDEIKTLSVPLESIDASYEPLHWAQAKCYAYMLATDSDLSQIDIRLTYYHTGTHQQKHIVQTFTLAELTAFFDDLLARYAVWAEFTIQHRTARNASIAALPFPYPAYRKGQRDLAAAAYRTIRDRRKLFIQAPTGTGKTMSVLFPAVKSMGEGMGEKIFYLTAKTVTRHIAEDALLRMQEKGLTAKVLTLTSRERICPHAGAQCLPEECPRAKGHFDRVNTAIYDILSSESMITRDMVSQYADKHSVCPFEMALDVSLWGDCIICDYNHVFDPRAYLRRFFEAGGDYTLLVDESHNLVDRARDMYSADLSKRAILDAKQSLKKTAPAVGKSLSKVNKHLLEMGKQVLAHGEDMALDFPAALLTDVEELAHEFEVILSHASLSPATLDLFFQCMAFLAVSRLYDDRYVTFVTREDGDVIVHLFCLDPAHLLAKACGKARTAVFFSATLQPLPFFRTLLGGEDEDRTLSLTSPFPSEHLSVLVAGHVSTRYRDRGENYAVIADYIRQATSQAVGNYLTFFPSFAFMKAVHAAYAESFPETPVMMQSTGMSEDDRAAFLDAFRPDPQETLLAFAVLGGLFAEGIDLTGDRLSGAIIVGVGLPQICLERDLIRDHFHEKNNMGFAYAYQYPGMNRVLQAAGRVIRSESDRGFVLLIDDRFLHKRYLELFPEPWQRYKRISSPAEAGRLIQTFWQKSQSISPIHEPAPVHGILDRKSCTNDQHNE